MISIRISKKLSSAKRRLREARMIARAVKSPYHPVLVHLIPIRRCNLSCTYCNEYDSVSSPVPTATLLHRIDLYWLLRVPQIFT